MELDEAKMKQVKEDLCKTKEEHLARVGVYWLCMCGERDRRAGRQTKRQADRQKSLFKFG